MVLNSVTRSVTNLATGLFHNGVAAVKFCNRTISVGYTNYLAPTVSFVAKSALAVVSNQTVQAAIALGSAAYFAKKGYTVYNKHNKHKPTADAITAAKARLEGAQTDVTKAQSALDAAKEEDKEGLKAPLQTAQLTLNDATSALSDLEARASNLSLAKKLAPHVALTVGSVALAVFVVIR